MHELIDALIFLFDVLLMPFTAGKEPTKTWVKITGALIVVVGVGGILALVAWLFLAPIVSNS